MNDIAIIIGIIGTISGIITGYLAWLRHKKTDFEEGGKTAKTIIELSQKVESLENSYNSLQKQFAKVDTDIYRTINKLDKEFIENLNEFKKDTREKQISLEKDIVIIRENVKSIDKNIDRILKKLFKE